jgi:peptidoglycan/LPS O-acetylase OafA/YrhL
MNLEQLLSLALVCWFVALAAAGLYLQFKPDGLPVTPWVMPDGYFWLHALKFNPLVHLPEFIAGMACGLWFLKGGHASRRATLLITCGVALFAFILVMSPRIPYPLMHTGLAAPAFAAIICGFSLRPAWSGFSHSRICTLLGESSYSLYLLHALVVGIVLFAPIGGSAGAHPPSPGPLRAVLAMVMASILGVVVFRYVEEPLRKRIRFGKARS